MKKVLLILFVLSGCASFQMPESFQYKQIEAEGFNLSAWVKTDHSSQSYHVYIEGDGYAFNANGQPTSNSTPKSSFMRRLAAKDSHANVIYLARPCQFTKGHACLQKYWTTARFAPVVIEAEYQAIKALSADAPLILIGYSGGAQVAGLIAATKNLNVKKIITIAGNLDHPAWTAYHNLPKLTESLSLADYKDKFNQIPQVHYVGQKDKIIPPVLTEKFVSDKSTIHIISDATHNNGWNTISFDD